MTRLAILLLAAAIAVVGAFLAAAVAGVLAYLDGASWPAALMRAATAFGATLTLAGVLAGVLSQLLH
ncbi:hypothetical protein [Kitasatospora sp. NPDC093679]|uniref:hypothetical protein n=1 Tax=Kitasatospora sp. NPDC093679 TaxID=3154983 RepID=UPI0034192AE3